MGSLRLKISVSGVRGVVGETLTPQLLSRFCQAYGTYVGQGKVLIGRDTRPSGAMVLQAACAGLMSTGCSPVDMGVAPIPAIQHRAASRADLCGAIAITASHNPAEWNALKLLSAEGLFLSTLEANELLDIYHQGAFRRAPGDQRVGLQRDDGGVDAHLDAVASQVDAAAIRAANLLVAVDCVNGAGAVATPQLLQDRLGCRLERIGCEPSGLFQRPPEPLPQNLGELRARVVHSGAVIGLAQDADADRLAVIDEHGRCLEGDQMLALLVDLALRRAPGPVVVNLSTSNLIEHVAAGHGVEVFRSPVGEANVVASMRRHHAVVGGEGSGGLIFPAVHHCRDSFAGMALLLEFVAGGGSVARFVDALPPRVRLSHKLPLPAAVPRGVLFQLRDTFADADIDLRDGLKASWPDRWLHVRASNTEPILRVMVEAEDRATAEEMHQDVVRRMRHRLTVDS